MSEDGFALVCGAASVEAIEAVLQGLVRAAPGEAVRSRGSETYAMRNVLDLVPEAAEVVASAPIRELVAAVLGRPGWPVKATLFDKTPAANWNVGWHQDLTIAVEERREVDEFRGWSLKAGIPHVQAPPSVLERMVALRLHLDPCGPDNGPLRVLPGSHRQGRLSSDQVRAWVEACEPALCPSPAGGALLLRPLLLHASLPAVAPGHRRVLHVEFTADELPGGLRWRRP